MSTAPTIDELISGLEVEEQMLDRRELKARSEAKLILEEAERQGRKYLNAEEDRRCEVLLTEVTNVGDDRAVLKTKLARAHKVKAEELETDRLSRQIHKGADRPGTGNSGDYRADRNGNLVLHASDRPEGPGQWTRQDGRAAAVERGQRFGDHEVVREQIDRTRGRDEHVIGMHGNLGMQLRAMSTSTGSAIVPTVWASDIIDRARNLAAVYQAGATMIPMSAKVEQIGRLTVDPVASFRTEGSTITASDPTFDNVTLTAKSLNCLVVGSMEWFMDSTPNAGDVVSEAIAKALAVQLDLMALYGGVTAGAEQTATGNNMLPSGGYPNPPNPTGVLANLLANASSSVLGGATNGTPQTAATFYKEVLDTIYTPRDFNEAPTAMLWPSHLARVYAEAADTTNQPMRQPPDVEALAKYVTNQIPSGFNQGTGTTMSDLFVGDWSQLLMGQRLDLQVQTLTERYAELGQLGILATFRGDIQVARPRAFAVYRYLKGA